MSNKKLKTCHIKIDPQIYLFSDNFREHYDNFESKGRFGQNIDGHLAPGQRVQFFPN